MIKVTSMDKRILAINVDMIERLESIPETMITLSTGKKIIVLETMDEVIDKIVLYHQKIFKCKCNHEDKFSCAEVG